MLANIFSYRVSEGPSLSSFIAERFRNYFTFFYLMLRSQGKRKYKCIINLGRKADISIGTPVEKLV